jgi:predicted transcriptional regulator
MIDLNEIAIEYNVLINDSITRIKVIDSKDIYELTESLRECDPKSLKKAKFMASNIKGKFPSVYHITWYTETEANYSIIDAILQANAEKNNIVVIEILPDE